jgi:chitodextrinase
MILAPRRALALALAIVCLTSVVAFGDATAAAWIFKDGFEGGNLSKWDTSQNVSVIKNSTLAFKGKWVARATSNGTAAYASDTLASTKVELFARVRFKIESQTSDAQILSLRTASGAELLSVGRASSGALTLTNGVTGGIQASVTTVTAGVWHEVMLHVHLDDDTSRWDVMFDHVDVPQLAALGALGTNPIGQFRVGESRSGRTVTMLLDDAGYDDEAVDDTAPSTPTGLSLQSLTAAAARVNWAANPAIDGVDRYSLYRDGVFVTAVNEDQNSFTDLTVTPGASYTYKVEAVDNAGNTSPMSAGIVVVVPLPNATGPTVPTGLAVDVVRSDQVSLVWNANPAADETRTYRIMRDGVEVGVVTGWDLYFIDTGLTPSTGYAYTIIARDVGGLSSAASPPVMITTSPSDTPTVWWGVATHKEGSTSDRQVRQNLESTIGRDFVTFRKYANWTQNIPSNLQRSDWDNEGIMPFTAWTTYVKGAGDLTYADIASGARDAEIHAQAVRIRDSEIPMFFTFQHEPEDGQGATDPQAGPPQDYIAAYIRIHDIFEEEEVDNVTWVNTLTLASFKRSKGKTAEAWSPPPQYYDYVGVDGYVRWPCVQWDGRPFFSFRDTFRESYEFAASLGKPLFIGEIGIIEQTSCGNTSGDPDAKADWYRETRAQMKAWPLVVGVAWTHATVNFLDSFLLDYHVDTSPGALEAFIEAGDDPYFGRSAPP